MNVYYSYISSSPIKRDIAITLKTIKRWSLTRGLVWTADTVKQHRLSITRYLSGEPLPRPAGISLTKDGISKLIPHQLRELIRSRDPRSISLVLTLLSITRCIKGGKPVDLAAITEITDSNTQEIEGYIPDFLKHYKINKINTDWTEFHWSTTMGPIGPSMVTSLSQWRLLPTELKEDILLIGGSKLLGLFNEYSGWTEAWWNALAKVFPCKNKSLFRKLSVKADYEAKSRVFAILDYWSQGVLRPIHLGLFQGLKRIPSDRTFVQAEGLTFDPSSDSYHSLDLSNATDRFPLKLQKALLSYLIGHDKAEAWARILVQYPYDLKGKSVLYGTGQPMGAYSSWAIFTMTHHLVVYVAARRAGKPRSWSNYVILGDDVVIADSAVAKEYRLLLQDLKVPISEAKTHTSRDVYEFAKRWFYKGQEVTAFPLHGLIENIKKHFLLLETFRQAMKFGFDKYDFSFRKPSLLLSLLKIHGYKGRYAHQYAWKFFVTATIPLAGATPDKVYESAKQFVELTGVWLSCTQGFTNTISIFERFVASSITWTLARESERIMNNTQTWYDQVYEVFSSGPMESVGQTELSSAVAETIPTLSALGKLASDTQDSVVPTDWSVMKGSIWDNVSKMRFVSLPTVKGILPIRASYRIAGARSTWALNLVRIWKRHEQGLRP